MLDATSLALKHLPNVKLRGRFIRSMNAIGTVGLSDSSGEYRTGIVRIEGSDHVPPDAKQIPKLISDLCVSVNQNWFASNAYDLAAYILWRLTWIHPFDDGNGRTADAVAYSMLCLKLGVILPGDEIVPRYWHANRDKRYYNALKDADAQLPNLPTGPQTLSDLLKRAVLNQILSANPPPAETPHSH